MSVAFSTPIASHHWLPGDPRTGEAICLGWPGDDARPRRRIGFCPDPIPAVDPPRQPILYRDDGHVLSVGPTGSGKFRSSMGPILSSYEGSVICVDLKGEAVDVFARRRQQLGQRVIVLDPFQVVTSTQRDTMNPLDLYQIPGGIPEVDVENLAAMLGDGHGCNTDPFWSDTGRALLAGILDYIRLRKPSEQNLTSLRQLMYSDDLDYDLAVILDKKILPVDSLAREEIVGYLSAPTDRTRPCIKTTALTFLKCLGSQVIAEATKESSFPLELLLDEKAAYTIFLVFPARYLESHRNLLRLMLHTLLTVVSRRPYMPALRTLLLFDEAAQYGRLKALLQALTLLRGSGLLVHTFWQDLSQIRSLYGDDYQTILNNCSALQLVGCANYQMAQTWSDVLNLPACDLLAMKPEEQALFIRGQGQSIGRKLDYLRDPEFAGCFDANPRYGLRTQSSPKPQSSKDHSHDKQQPERKRPRRPR